MYYLLNIEEEIQKEEKIKTKREWVLRVGGISYTIIAIIIVLFGQPIPIVTEVLIPLSVGIGVGLLLSLGSIKLSYDASIRLIKIQSTLDEMKNESKTKTLDDELHQEIDKSSGDKKQTFFFGKN